MAAPLFQHPADNLMDPDNGGGTRSLSVGSAAVGYSLADTYNGNPALGLHLAAATEWRALIDFGNGNNKAVKLVGFVNHNLDASIVVSIQAHSSDSWGSPTLSYTVTVPAADADGLPTHFYWLLETQTQALRYWRIGTATTNSAAVILGQLWVSDTIRRFPDNADFREGMAAESERFAADIYENGFGAELAFPKSSRIVLINGTVQGYEESDLDPVIDWRRACLGPVKPTLFIRRDDVNRCLFVRHGVEEPQRTHVSGSDDSWMLPVALKSLSNGPGR